MPPSFLIFISSQQSAHKQEIDDTVANMSKLYGINSLLSVNLGNTAVNDIERAF